MAQTIIKVVAGVVYRNDGAFLLTSRPEGKAYAGYWEFAGGKVEEGESLTDALKREFWEELGISIHHATPWLNKIHVYEHATVDLHFFRVNAGDWSGDVHPREQQQYAWQHAGQTTVEPMLPANHDLLAALSIPDVLAGTPQTGLTGINRSGMVYQVAPFALSHAHHQAVLFNDVADIARFNKQGQSIWVAVHDNTAWQMGDADVLFWHIADEHAAQQLLNTLNQGVAQAVVVYANPTLCRHFETTWRAHGVHAVVVEKTYVV